MDEIDFASRIKILATACESIEPGSFDVVMKALNNPSEFAKAFLSKWPEDAVARLIQPTERTEKGLFKSNSQSRDPGHPIPAIKAIPEAKPLLKGVIAACKMLVSEGSTLNTSEQLFKDEIRKLLNTLISKQEDVEIWYKIIRPVVSYEPKIKKDIEYADENGNPNKEAIVNRLIELIFDTIFSTLDSPNWPVGERGVRPETMARIIGIELPRVKTPTTSVEYANKYKDYSEKILQGDAVALKSARLACCHLLARLIARERGYDKGQSEKTTGRAEIEGLIHKPVIYRDEDTGEKRVDVKDPNWQKSLDNVENRLMLQSVIEEITDPIDKLALTVYQEAQLISLQEAYQQYSAQCVEYGLNSPNSISQRVARLKKVYPELSKFNPFRD